MCQEIELMLGDKDTGARVTELTLTIFMVDQRASELDPRDMTKPERD